MMKRESDTPVKKVQEAMFAPASCDRCGQVFRLRAVLHDGRHLDYLCKCDR